MIFSVLFALLVSWTPDLEQAIEGQLCRTQDWSQRELLEKLKMQKNLDGFEEVSLGQLRVTGYYTPVVYTREKAQKKAKMQGSAFWKNSEGVQKLLSYRGKKGGKDNYCVLDDSPRGASGVSLTAAYSAAVDPKKIPYGSILIAHIHGEDRILLAQDTGAKVQRRNEIDIYMGVGEKARQEALKLHHTYEIGLLFIPPYDYKP